MSAAWRPLSGPSETGVDRGRSRLVTWALSVPIRVKIMGIALGMVALLGLGVTAEVRWRMQATLRAELRHRAAAIARDVAGRAADLIVTHDLFALHELVRATLENNEDVRYVLVLDRAGLPLSHTLAGTPSPELLAANWPDPGHGTRVQPLATEEGLVYDAAVSIFGGRAGVARVGMSERRTATIVAGTTRRILAVTGLVSLGGVAAALLLTFVLTRPLLALGRVAEAVGRGDFGHKAPVWSRDEIGRLTETFNAMTEALDRSHRQLLRRNAELSALNAVAVTVSGSLHLREILQGALTKVVELMRLRAGWVHLDEGGALVLASATGLAPGEELPEADAVVPLRAQERVLGVMQVVAGEGRALDRDDVDLLQAIGHQVALAVENARLYQEVQRKEAIRGQLVEKLITAQEEERRRLSRELHDEVGQSLTALIMNVAGAEASVPADLDDLRRQLGEIRGMLCATLEEIRRLMVNLRPTLLDDLGLIPALQWLAGTHLRPAGVEYRLDVVGGRRRLAPHVETALFRVVQEAVTNIIRHSGARQATLRLEFRPASLAVEVADDGRGFDPGRTRRGLGLLGMEERVTLLGGCWRLETSPGAGTRIAFEIPAGRSA